MVSDQTRMCKALITMPPTMQMASSQPVLKRFLIMAYMAMTTARSRAQGRMESTISCKTYPALSKVMGVVMPTMLATIAPMTISPTMPQTYMSWSIMPPWSLVRYLLPMV